MRTSTLVLFLLIILIPLSSTAWISSGDSLYTMDDLVAIPACSVTTANSVKFVIHESITISARDTLLIDPGDSLCFEQISPVIVLRINGCLLADGTEENPIVFTSNEPAPDTSNWGRIEFEKNPPGSILDHCHVSYAATGISCDSSGLQTISNVNITTVGSNAVSLKNSSPTIRNCTLTAFEGSGIICTGNSAPLVGGSLATSNKMYNKILPTGFTFKNFTSNTITATYNDWGVSDSTYVDSLIVDDEEGFGEVVFIPFYYQDSTPPLSISDLTASKTDSNLALSWSAVTTDTSGGAEYLHHYVIYRDTTSHFTPQNSDSIASTSGTTLTDTTGTVGDFSTNSYYVVLAVDETGNKSTVSNRVGEYDFQLESTTGTDFTWIALCLDDTTLQMASDLEAHIQTHSSSTIDCKSIAEWNATSQTYSKYLTEPEPSGDFPLRAGGAYRVELDSTAVWTLTGDVLDPDSLNFQLKVTTGTDFTWISIPLQLDTLQMASDLEAHIQSHSSPTTDCKSIAEWNAISQTYSKYLTEPEPSGDFPVRAGKAYRVEVDTESIWPAP